MTEKATEGDFVVAEGPSVWGKPRGGWHFHDGEFVGLYWFLWAGESWATVVAPAATQLQDLFSGIAGSPVDVGEASGPATGFRASWTVDGYSIEIDVRPWSRPGRGCVWLRSLGGGVFAALRGGLVAAITQDWLQVGVAV